MHEQKVGVTHRSVLHASCYEHSLSEDITAIYVAADPAETEKIKKKWQYWGGGVRFHIIESPYRRLVEPLTGYIDRIADMTSPQHMLTVVVPYFIPEHGIYNALHMNTTEVLRKALIQKYDIVIMEVSYHLDETL